MLKEPEIRCDNYDLHYYLTLQTLTETASVMAEHLLEKHNRNSPTVLPPANALRRQPGTAIKKRAPNMDYHISWAERTYRDHTADESTPGGSAPWIWPTKRRREQRSRPTATSPDRRNHAAMMHRTP